MLFPAPSQRMFYPGDGPVESLDVEVLVDPIGPARERIDPVQHEVKMAIVRVLVQSIEASVVLHPELVQQKIHRLLDGTRSRAFSLPPRQNIMLDGILGTDRLFGQGNHFGCLGGKRVREKSPESRIDAFFGPIPLFCQWEMKNPPLPTEEER